MKDPLIPLMRDRGQFGPEARERPLVSIIRIRRIPAEDGSFDLQQEPVSIDNLRIQVCKPRITGEQKIILYGKGINAKDSNRRVVKFAPSYKRRSGLKPVFQEINPTEKLMFTLR